MDIDRCFVYVESLIKKAEASEKADDALKFSQAACNSANTLNVIRGLTVRYPTKPE